MVCFDSSGEWYINLRGLSNAKLIYIEEHKWYYLTHSLEDKDVHTFPKASSPEVDVITQVETM